MIQSVELRTGINRMSQKLIDQTTGRFILVGIANTIFGTAIMYIAYNLLGCSYWVSSAMNYIFGSILSFFLNKYFTFKSKGKKTNEVIRFVINIAICYFIAYGVAKPLVAHILTDLSTKWQENIAMAVGMILFVGLNYIGQRFFVFKKPDKNVIK